MRILFLFVLVLGVAGCSQEEPIRLGKTKITTNSVPINLSAEMARANAEKKPFVLHFTGSDWCFACALMERDVFSKPIFQDYEKSNLVMVEIDLPQRTKIPEAILSTNIALAEKFNVASFPTLLLLDQRGKELWRIEGYTPGGLKPLIEKFEARRQELQKSDAVLK